MCLTEGNAYGKSIHGGIETLEVNLVDSLLPLCKAGTHRHRRREVAGIVRLGLSPRIKQEDVTLATFVDKTVIVKHLPLNGSDGRERKSVAVTASYLFNSGCHLRLVNARTYRTIGRKMHLGAQIHALLNQPDLFQILVVALRHYSLNESHTRTRRLSCRLNTKQLPQPHTVVAAIRGQEMHGLPFLARLVYIGLQLADTESGGTLLQSRHRARPHDIINGEFVAEDYLAVLINIDDCSKVGVVHPEEIQEGAVLTELIGVVSIIHADLCIAEEEQQAAAHIFLQSGTSLHVCVFTDLHSVMDFVHLGRWHSFTFLCLLICSSVSGKYSARRA